MCKVFFLVLAALALCHGLPVESEGQWDSRLAGGSDAAMGSAPYMVSVRYTNNLYICAGTIITPRTILTSASCAFGLTPKFAMVIAGTNKLNAGGTRYEISERIVHGDYYYFTKINDIGLIILSSPIEMTDLVKPITLSEAETGAEVFVNMTGWGTTSFPGSTPKNDLQTIIVKTISIEACAKVHTGAESVLMSNICTLTKMYEGACHGDEGGPLVDISTGAQVGIVSWFHQCARGIPDVFTRVSSYISWINENKVD